MEPYDRFFVKRKILITGGLGFIGSSIAHRLVDMGAHVTLVDLLSQQYGGNLFNKEYYWNRGDW